MCAALNQFFTPRHEDKEAKLPQKICASLEKNNDLLILCFYNCALEGRSQGES